MYKHQMASRELSALRVVGVVLRKLFRTLKLCGILVRGTTGYLRVLTLLD